MIYVVLENKGFFFLELVSLLLIYLFLKELESSTYKLQLLFTLVLFFLLSIIS